MKFWGVVFLVATSLVARGGGGVLKHKQEEDEEKIFYLFEIPYKGFMKFRSSGTWCSC
jgi:hypothetical protein